jgi:hypothetical protein
VPEERRGGDVCFDDDVFAQSSSIVDASPSKMTISVTWG